MEDLGMGSGDVKMPTILCQPLASQATPDAGEKRTQGSMPFFSI